MAKTTNKKQKIEFKIVEIKKISYYQNDLSSSGLSDNDTETGQVNLGAKILPSKEEGTITVIIKTDFFITKNNKRYDLFGIETSHKYAIRNLSKLFYDAKKNVLDIPDNIIISFLDISISNTRGMLATLNSNPSFSRILLPIINPIDIFKNIKKRKQKAL